MPDEFSNDQPAAASAAEISETWERFRKALDALKEQGVTNAQVATYLGISTSGISRLQRGPEESKHLEILSFLKKIEAEYGKKRQGYIHWDEEENDYQRFKDPKISIRVTPQIALGKIVDDVREKSRKTVRVIDTWLPSINHGEGLRNLRGLIYHTRERLQILLLNPKSEALRLRALGLKTDTRQAQKELVKDLAIILDEYEHAKGKTCELEIRLYDHIPALNAFLLDDTAYFGNYLIGDHSENHFFQHTEKNFIVDQINQHFETIWEHPNTERVNTQKVEALEKWLENKGVEKPQLSFFATIKNWLTGNPNGSEEHDILKRFAASGPWALYYPEVYQRHLSNLQGHDYLNAIGKGIFTVFQDRGKFKARLETLEIAPLEGIVQVSKVNNVHYLNCMLGFSSGQNVQLNLLIRVSTRFPSNTEQSMSGLYNIVYVNQNLGCGLLQLRKEGDETPEIMDPILPNKEFNNKLYPSLIFKESSSLVWNRDHEAFSHAGVYEIFNYGLQRHEEVETKCIIHSMARVHPNRFVEFKGIFPHGIAYGKAQLILNNLYYELKNSSHENTRDRRGFFIVAVRAEEPRLNDAYGGVFAGLTSADHVPLGKRCVFRFIGNDEETLTAFSAFEGKRIRIFSPEYEKIPKAIRDTLTGRLSNFIGFFGRRFFNLGRLADLRKHELPLAEILFESALFRAKEAKEPHDIPEIVRLLRQAFHHGLRDVERVEEALRKTPLAKQILEYPEYIEFKKVMRPESPAES